MEEASGQACKWPQAQRPLPSDAPGQLLWRHRVLGDVLADGRPDRARGHVRQLGEPVLHAATPLNEDLGVIVNEALVHVVRERRGRRRGNVCGAKGQGKNKK